MTYQRSPYVHDIISKLKKKSDTRKGFTSEIESVNMKTKAQRLLRDAHLEMRDEDSLRWYANLNRVLTIAEANKIAGIVSKYKILKQERQT